VNGIFGRWATVLASLGIVASIGACGSANDANGTWNERANQICALYTPCCVAAGLPTSEQLCHASFALPPSDPAASDQCLADLTAQSKSADFCTLSLPEPDSCAKAYPKTQPQGTHQPGDACNADQDCAPSEQGTVHCTKPFHGKGDGWICQVQAHAKAGEACVGTTDGSVTQIVGDDGAPVVPICYATDALFCDAGTCKPIGQAGDACTTDTGCAKGTYCDGSTCAAKLPVGSACGASSSACDDQAYCAFPESVCKARVAEGGACDSDEQCLTAYCDGATCKKPSLGALGLVVLCP
jgi:hypothetical protein